MNEGHNTEAAKSLAAEIKAIKERAEKYTLSHGSFFACKDVSALCKLVEKMLKDLDEVGRAYARASEDVTPSQYLETVKKRDARYARILRKK